MMISPDILLSIEPDRMHLVNITSSQRVRANGDITSVRNTEHMFQPSILRWHNQMELSPKSSALPSLACDSCWTFPPIWDRCLGVRQRWWNIFYNHLILFQGQWWVDPSSQSLTIYLGISLDNPLGGSGPSVSQWKLRFHKIITSHFSWRDNLVFGPQGLTRLVKNFPKIFCSFLSSWLLSL